MILSIAEQKQVCYLHIHGHNSQKVFKNNKTEAKSILAESLGVSILLESFLSWEVTYNKHSKSTATSNCLSSSVTFCLSCINIHSYIDIACIYWVDFKSSMFTVNLFHFEAFFDKILVSSMVFTKPCEKST